MQKLTHAVTHAHHELLPVAFAHGGVAQISDEGHGALEGLNGVLQSCKREHRVHKSKAMPADKIRSSIY